MLLALKIRIMFLALVQENFIEFIIKSIAKLCITLVKFEAPI